MHSAFSSGVISHRLYATRIFAEAVESSGSGKPSGKRRDNNLSTFPDFPQLLFDKRHVGANIFGARRVHRTGISAGGVFILLNIYTYIYNYIHILYLYSG